jgi:beta-glucosidase
LFPFGHGLSYTTFAYSGLKVSSEGDTNVTFTVKNTGQREGAEVAQVYASLPASASEPPKRLVGFSKVWLKPGESKDIMIPVHAKYLSIFDEGKNAWQLVPGTYTIMVGGSSKELPLTQSIDLK